ncbi:hypothetical protein M0Q50_08015 [bacterium]|jgi:hypothetical protein|nr:hypothetical protein [bacterium]
MEQILKKSTKITKSIIDQTVIGSSYLYYDNKDYDILGWCVNNKHMYIILYNRISNTLVKLYRIMSENDITLESNNENIFNINTNNYEYYTYKTLKIYSASCKYSFNFKQTKEETDEDMEIFYNKSKLFIAEVNEKGQFYL